MTIYDVAMVGLVIAGMVWGAWRGIVWQVASLSSLVLGYMVAHALSPQIAPSFPGDPLVARALAMLVLYVAVAGGVFLAAWIVRSTLRQLKFEAFDRHLGMVMGGLEGGLLGLVATLFIVSLAPQTRASIFASPSGRVVGQVMNVVGPVLPAEARQALAPFWSTGSPGSRIDAQVQQADLRPSAGSLSDAVPSSAKLEKMIEDGESRIGRAIAETAKQELQGSSKRE